MVFRQVAGSTAGCIDLGGGGVPDGSSSGASPQRLSLTGSIQNAGYAAEPDVEQLQALAATVQQHRFDIKVSPHLETTRSTALWSAMKLDDQIRTSLEDSKISMAKLTSDLKLTTDSFTTPATTTTLHDDFAHAMIVYLRQRAISGPVGVAEVVLAILLTARDPTRGQLPGRVGNVDTAIVKMRALAGVPSPRAFDPQEFSESVRALNRTFSGDSPVTPGLIATALQQSKAHRDYAGGRFVLATFNRAGTEAPFEEWCGQVRRLYDMELVRKSREKVIDGRLLLIGLAHLDDDFAVQLRRDGLLDALRTEVSVLITVRPPEAPAKALDGEGAVHPVDIAPQEREHVRWLADEPVGREGDELGRRGVAEALQKQLSTLASDSPGRSFLIHVDGAWGSGKSSLLRLLSEAISNPGSADDQAKPWLIVSYDAWRQAKAGPPWLTLLQAIRAAVQNDQQHFWRRWLFWARERARLISDWQWAAIALVIVVAIGVTIVAILFGAGLTLNNWGDVAKIVGGLVPVAAAVWLLAGFIGRFMTLDSTRSARAFVETRADPMEDITAHFDWILRRAGRPVLLLADDLDRCPEAFVVDLLDSIQKLMRDRTSPTGAARKREPSPCLFVILAADGRWIRNSYDNVYSSLADAVKEPGASLGTLFLEKLFQLVVPVPMLSEELKAQYLSDLLAREAGVNNERAADPVLIQQLKDAAPSEVLGVLASVPALDRIKASDVAIERLVVEQQAQQHTRHVLEPFAPLLDPTPRALKRFVMAYSMLRAVRTAEGSVVGIGPLALWTVLLTRWPLLAQYLQDNPQAVRLFALAPDQVSVSTPAELVPLFNDPPEELRAVMNHAAGPLNEETLRRCNGQSL
jgi:hypothetical protein